METIQHVLAVLEPLLGFAIAGALTAGLHELRII